VSYINPTAAAAHGLATIDVKQLLPNARSMALLVTADDVSVSLTPSGAGSQYGLNKKSMKIKVVKMLLTYIDFKKRVNKMIV
jgi:hypothetical protein